MNLKYGNIVRLRCSSEELLVIGPANLLKQIGAEKEMFGISEDYPQEIIFFNPDEVEYVDTYDSDSFHTAPIFSDSFHLEDKVILLSGAIGQIVAVSPVVFPVQYEILFLVKTNDGKLLIVKDDEMVKLVLPEH